jgi:hypothetical protein
MKQRNKITDILILLIFAPIAFVAGVITWYNHKRKKL